MAPTRGTWSRTSLPVGYNLPSEVLGTDGRSELIQRVWLTMLLYSYMNMICLRMDNVSGVMGDAVLLSDSDSSF
jgi:hypothetical protein